MNFFSKNSKNTGRRRPQTRKPRATEKKGAARPKTDHPPPFPVARGLRGRKARRFFRARALSRRPLDLSREEAEQDRSGPAPHQAKPREWREKTRARGKKESCCCCCCSPTHTGEGSEPLSRATPPGAWRSCSRSWGRPRTSARSRCPSARRRGTTGRSGRPSRPRPCPRTTSRRLSEVFFFVWVWFVWVFIVGE
jgi:hypothetical protein